MSWEGLEGVKEVMEALLNLAALEFSILPHSFQSLVIVRGFHKNNLRANHSGTAHEVLLEAFCN